MGPIGILLAGGASSRMGGGDKTLLALAGRPILAHVLDRVGLQLTVLALSANGDPARFRDWCLPVVADSIAGHPGPLAGILAGMAWAADTYPDAETIVSISTDTPFLPRDLVERLAAARRRCGAEIAVASSGGRIHPIIALWPVAIAEALRRALVEEGVRKVESFARRYRLAIAEFSAGPPDPFFNVNSPQDREEAERLAIGS